MTPKMEAALLAAASAPDGLIWTVAGWENPAAPHVYHGPVVVSRLVWTHGYLAEAGKPSRKPGVSRRVITDKGRAYLAGKVN